MVRLGGSELEQGKEDPKESGRREGLSTSAAMPMEKH